MCITNSIETVEVCDCPVYCVQFFISFPSFAKKIGTSAYPVVDIRNVLRRTPFHVSMYCTIAVTQRNWEPFIGVESQQLSEELPQYLFQEPRRLPQLLKGRKSTEHHLEQNVLTKKLCFLQPYVLGQRKKSPLILSTSDLLYLCIVGKVSRIYNCCDDFSFCAIIYQRGLVCLPFVPL